MEVWKEGKIKDFAEVKGGKRLPKGKQLVGFPTAYPYIRIRDIGKSKVLQLTKRAGKNYLNEFASGQRDTKGIPDAIIVYQYALICIARIRIKDGRKEGASR